MVAGSRKGFAAVCHDLWSSATALTLLKRKYGNGTASIHFILILSSKQKIATMDRIDDRFIVFPTISPLFVRLG
jgi:hypothetical protein